MGRRRFFSKTIFQLRFKTCRKLRVFLVPPQVLCNLALNLAKRTGKPARDRPQMSHLVTALRETHLHSMCVMEELGRSASETPGTRLTSGTLKSRHGASRSPESRRARREPRRTATHALLLNPKNPLRCNGIHRGTMSTSERFERLLDKFAPALLGLLMVYAFARSVAAGTGKIYWLDELLTQLVTAQGSVSKIMSALRAPIDGQPPLFYLIENLASRLIANQDIALRLPASFGLVCTILFVYIFLRRESSRLIALLSTAFLLATAAWLYAEEARPYSMVVGCISLALVCYQRAPSPKWTVLLGASLALAQSLHYLAVLSFVPFGLAELAESLRAKKVRWGVWSALVVGALPLLLFWNLLALNKAYYGAYHAALGYNFARAVHAYGELLVTDGAVGMGIAVAAAVGLAISWRNPPREPDQPQLSGRQNEQILIAGLLGLPFIAYVFVLVTHAPMAARYFLPGVLGFPLSVGFTLARIPKQAALFFAAYLLATVGVTEMHFWRYIAAGRSDLANQGAATAKFIASVGHPQLPVVVPSGDILWVVRYAFPDSPGRFVYLTKDQDGPNDTTDKSLTNAQRYAPIQVQRASDFIAANPIFLIYDGSGSPSQWLTLQVLREGCSVELLAADGNRAVYIVQKPQAAN